jgi:hypothetical protein
MFSYLSYLAAETLYLSGILAWVQPYGWSHVGMCGC